MALKTNVQAKQLDCTPAKRCSDFDDDCKDVKSHSRCWSGPNLGPADGYCPFLFGMELKS